MKKTLIMIAAAGLMTGLVGWSLADDAGRADKAGMMQGRFIAKMQEKLGLDDAATAKVTAIFKKYGDQKKELRAGMRKDIQALKEILDTPKYDEASLTPILNRLADARLKMQTLKGYQMNEVRQVLTPTQQAKVVLQLTEFKKGMKKRFHGEFDKDPVQE